MLSELLDAMDRADRDDDVRAVVLTGAGRGFCAGADLSGGANTFNEQSRNTAVGFAAAPDQETAWIRHDHTPQGSLKPLERYDATQKATYGP